MQEVFSVLFFIFLAATKILLAPATMLAAGYGVIKTIIVTYVGSMLGAMMFYYFGVAIFNWWDKLTGVSQKKKHIFSKKTRALVAVKTRYGIIGIASISFIISIPISAFIIAKIFPGKNKVIGIYALVLIPISIGLTLLSKPVIEPLVLLIKRIFHLS